VNQSWVNRAADFRSSQSRISQRLDYERKSAARYQEKIKQLEEDKAQLLKAVALIDRAIQIISANGIGTIESVVTAGLRLVFDDPTLGLIISKKDGARGISYDILLRQGDTVGNPMDMFGGGCVNVASFLLRVLMIKRFKLAKFLAVDESFNNVNGDENKRSVSELLHKLCHDYGFTILAITGEQLLTSSADHIYQVSTEGRMPVIKDYLETPSQNSGRDSGQSSGDDTPLPSSLAQA